MDIKTLKSKKVGKLIVIILAVIIFLGAVLAAGYFYNQNRKIIQNPDAISKAETAKLVDKVGKLITLPGDESPSVATVTDKDKLKDQPFFAKSENDDKVLIYTNAKKAILYRPSTDKIIEVMPISFNQPAPVEAPKPAETPKK